MTADAIHLGALEKALNDTASKSSVLWTAFITFELYLVITLGSVKHRDIFLQIPIKLPVLNVELPLVPFFWIAPAILVFFHFYVFLQLSGLAAKANDYNVLLNQEIRIASDREYYRQRLDLFLILQFIAGSEYQRSNFQGFSLHMISWVTLCAAPIIIILQALVTFLPYHYEPVTCAHRVILLLDLTILWIFWKRVSGRRHSNIRQKSSRGLSVAGALLSIGVLLFGTWVATFPGERAHKYLPTMRLIPRIDKTLRSNIHPQIQQKTWAHHWFGFFYLNLLEHAEWTSIHELLFAGAVDEVNGKPRSLFSNRLVLTDQSFIDAEKLDKVNVAQSFRGRHLQFAVLNRADLRKSDFTAADLTGASLSGASLQNARLGCVVDGHETTIDTVHYCTILQGADFSGANIEAADFGAAELQGAKLASVKTSSKTNFVGAQLVAADLRDADLYGVDFSAADLRGASLTGAKINNIVFSRATRLDGTAFSDRSVAELTYLTSPDSNINDHKDAKLIWDREKENASDEIDRIKKQEILAKSLKDILDCRNPEYYSVPGINGRIYIIYGLIRNNQMSHAHLYVDDIMGVSNQRCSDMDRQNQEHSQSISKIIDALRFNSKQRKTDNISEK